MLSGARNVTISQPYQETVRREDQELRRGVEASDRFNSEGLQFDTRYRLQSHNDFLDKIPPNSAGAQSFGQGGTKIFHYISPIVI